MPDSERYFSAFLAIPLGSFSYVEPSSGSITSHVTLIVGSSKNGSAKAVDVSGISIMSDSLISFHPAMEDPSNIFPSSQSVAMPSSVAVTVTCCSLPCVLVNL